MQNWMIHANIFFHIFKIFGLTFIAIIKNHIHPVRAHVNYPNINHYDNLCDGTISIYFDPADTPLPWLQLYHLFLCVICFNLIYNFQSLSVPDRGPFCQNRSKL